jgi:lipopolysaccharide transport system ATP-binding protein
MIKAENLTKAFRLYHDPKDRLKEIFLRREYSREITALKNLSFQVQAGETLGIIGENGAGKSTLLKILTGILLPTSGRVQVDGSITGLLELGTGFNHEFTGMKNIYMNGLLIGMSREEIDKKLESIIEFTELGEFIKEPIKTYSSGMLMRLAFSIAIHAEPAAFVIDEALSVGDAYFQQKCMNRIKGFREAGGSIIFVSHDLNAVKILCDRALLLSHGEAAEEGSPEKVINTYNFLLAKKSKGEEIRFDESGGMASYGNFKVKISGIELLNEAGVNSTAFFSGEKVRLKVHLKANEDVERVVVGILIRDRFGQDIFGTNTHHMKRVVSMKAWTEAMYEFDFRLNIGPGKYTLTSAVHRDDTHVNESYHWYDNILRFEVLGPKENSFIGLSKLDIGLHISTTETQ